jgi:hypothetical protein
MAAAVVGRVALACSFPGDSPLVIEPQAQATDPTPPSSPTASLASLRRGKGPDRNLAGCSQSISSCDDLGTIGIALHATDDQTPSADLGYQVQLAAGRLPDDLTLPAGPVTLQGGYLYLRWIDGATDDQEAISFTLAIAAVDKAGNVGPSVSLQVSDPGSGGGCSFLCRRVSTSWLALVIVVLAGRRVGRRLAGRSVGPRIGRWISGRKPTI